MILRLRIIGITEEEDYSREAQIDAALSEIPPPHSKAVVEQFYEKFPPQYYVSLNVVLLTEDGKRVGSLSLRESEWDGDVSIGAEKVLVG